jgi:hypothetical protein
MTMRTHCKLLVPVAILTAASSASANVPWWAASDSAHKSGQRPPAVVDRRPIDGYNEYIDV